MDSSTAAVAEAAGAKTQLRRCSKDYSSCSPVFSLPSSVTERPTVAASLPGNNRSRTSPASAPSSRTPRTPCCSARAISRCTPTRSVAPQPLTSHHGPLCRSRNDVEPVTTVVHTVAGWQAQGILDKVVKLTGGWGVPTGGQLSDWACSGLVAGSVFRVWLAMPLLSVVVCWCRQQGGDGGGAARTDAGRALGQADPGEQPQGTQGREEGRAAGAGEATRPDRCGT